MQQQPSVETDVISYSSAISACETGAQPEQALELLRDLAVWVAQIHRRGTRIEGSEPQSMRVLPGAVKRQNVPRSAAGGVVVLRSSLRLATATTPRLPAAPLAGRRSSHHFGSPGHARAVDGLKRK